MNKITNNKPYNKTKNFSNKMNNKINKDSKYKNNCNVKLIGQVKKCKIYRIKTKKMKKTFKINYNSNN